MGWIAHDAIVVTAFRRKDAETAREKAIELGLTVTEIVTSPSNGYETFLIVPDGSKEGWADSDIGNARRSRWTEWAQSLIGEPFISFVHVRYGETPAHVVKANGEYEE